MKLTKEEQQIILDLRKSKEKDKPKLMGFCKEDFYVSNLANLNVPWLLTKSEKEDIEKNFSNNFKMVVPQNSRFVCFIDELGEEWYDEIYGIEGMGGEWARKYLKDIKPYKE